MGLSCHPLNARPLSRNRRSSGASKDEAQGADIDGAAHDHAGLLAHLLFQPLHEGKIVRRPREGKGALFRGKGGDADLPGNAPPIFDPAYRLDGRHRYPAVAPLDDGLG